MQTVSVNLNDRVYEQIVAAAAQRRCSIEEFLTELLARIPVGGKDPLLGSMAADADLLDEVVRDAMHARQTQPLRTGDVS